VEASLDRLRAMDLRSKDPLVVFLDVDGTLLYYPADKSGREELELQHVCEGLDEFLEYVVRHCEPYWLTYRARLGRRDMLESHLFPHLPAVAQKIPVAHWDKSKHEAFVPDGRFVWFDDDPEPPAVQWLHRRKLSHALVRTDRHSRQNPARMLEVLKRLNEGAHHPPEQVNASSSHPAE
jgi:hypothetical protein